MSDQRLGGDVGHRPSPASKPHSIPTLADARADVLHSDEKTCSLRDYYLGDSPEHASPDFLNRDLLIADCRKFAVVVSDLEEQLQTAEKLAEDRAMYAHEQAARMGALQEQLGAAQEAVIRHMNEVRGAQEQLQAIAQSYDPARAEESARVMYDIARSTPKRDERGRLLDPEWAEKMIKRWSPESTPASGRDVGHRPSPPGTNITGDGTGETLPPIVEVGEQPLRTSNPASTPEAREAAKVPEKTTTYSRDQDVRLLEDALAAGKDVCARVSEGPYSNEWLDALAALDRIVAGSRSLEEQLEAAQKALADALDVAIWLSALVGNPDDASSDEAADTWQNVMRPKLFAALGVSSPASTPDAQKGGTDA